ncbi:hypothetical protein SAMN05443244_3684 [Terriglobus roseus]|uniref:Swt1-like HEPN domain-containing protein n=1 Tax=Terriglobus roseus TaxID=392734 RepID=A0A1H4T9K7_9BACT|nr:hypothetical protein SAMN05443244_3684 [Terriglobus roseus]
MLTEQALDGTQRELRSARSPNLDQGVARSVALETLDPEFVLRARRMATAYTAIAAFENGVREFVLKRLLESDGENWWQNCVSERIRKKAESRREEEAKVRWHTPRGDQLLNYTEFGDLTAIISQNWEKFEVHLREIDWVRHIISTLERSRNVIMHSGELANADLERVGSVIRDWIKQVGA